MQTDCSTMLSRLAGLAQSLGGRRKNPGASEKESSRAAECGDTLFPGRYSRVIGLSKNSRWIHTVIEWVTL
jgi:hypothetical protein